MNQHLELKHGCSLIFVSCKWHPMMPVGHPALHTGRVVTASGGKMDGKKWRVSS